MRSEDFDVETALTAAQALTRVLAGRTHKRKVLGQVLTVPGQLGSALKVPTIISQLQSKVSNRRQHGLDSFQQLWDTLSEATRNEVLNLIGWYDPEQLDWDDKRSNRRPIKIETDK
ncbi:MAG: hypothetical protein IPM37_22275 [Hahellaceae bacterium]|nr:hypothetical protein [Hahellaceae bacterium]